MIGKILVAIDHKESSQNALVQASILARSEGSRIVLQSVVPSYNGDLRMMGHTEALEEMRTPYRNALDKAHATAKVFNLRPKTVFEEGEPGNQILSLAEKEQVDLIVINLDSRNLAQRIPFGEVTAKIISDSKKDILVIPESSELKLERILLAFDQSDASRIALNRAIELSLTYGSELTIFNAYEIALEGFSYSPGIWNDEVKKAKKLLYEAEKLAQSRGVRLLNTVMKHGKVSQEISEFAKSLNAGLIVLGCKKGGSIRKMLQGNVVGRVINNRTIPVWISKH